MMVYLYINVVKTIINHPFGNDFYPTIYGDLGDGFNVWIHNDMEVSINGEIPKMVGLEWKIPLKGMILGCLHLWKPPEN